MDAYLPLIVMMAAAVAGCSSNVPSTRVIGSPVAAAATDASEITFEPFNAKGAKPSVIGGEDADPALWPASFHATIKTAKGNETCTATLVGPIALLTAAHCVKNNGTVTIQHNGGPINAKCIHHPKYDATYDEDTKNLSASERAKAWNARKNGVSADFAMCRLEKPVDVPYETPLINGKQLETAKSLLLAGVGCNTVDMDPGLGPDGKRIFRTGKSAIVSLPAGDYLYIETDWSKPVNDSDIGASICPGDSGGAAFFLGGNANPASRRIAGVNSRVSQALGGDVTGHSYISSLATPSANAFLKKWAETNKTQICGLDDSPTNCRSL